MRAVYGIGDFRYEYVEGWGTLPAGVTFHECPALRLMRRTMSTCSRAGSTRSWCSTARATTSAPSARGTLATGPGLYIAQDSSLLVADDGLHTIQKFTTDGDQLLEIGTRNAPAMVKIGDFAATICDGQGRLIGSTRNVCVRAASTTGCDQ